MINGSISLAKFLKCGFPQGAILAGIFYNMFTASLGKVAKKHEVSHEGYADDNNWYIAFISSDSENKLKTLSNSLEESRMWFLMNNLKVNDSKTQVICFTPTKSNTTPIQAFTLGSSTITPVSNFKNLGVTLDSLMNMENMSTP